MPFRNRFRPIVKTEKHEIVHSFLAGDASSQQNVTLGTGVTVGNKTGPTDTAIGSHVRSIFFELNVSALTITNPKIVHWTVSFNPTGAGSVPSPATYDTSSKSRIIHRGMEMLPKDASTVFKRVFVVRVPKKYQRQVEGRSMMFNYIATSAELINLCFFAIYKEIY